MSTAPSTTHVVADESVPEGEHPARWRRPDGLDLLGPMEGSGLQHPTYLVRRADGQVVQLSELLHVVLETLDPGSSLDEVAGTVSGRVGRELPAELLEHVLTTKLGPLGLATTQTVSSDRSDSTPHDEAARAPRARPLLSLSLRGTLFPTAAVAVISRLLAPLYWPPVVVAALVGAIGLDVVLLREARFTEALGEVLTTPALLLALWLVLTATGIVHELGHAAACRYGGGVPGRIGFGVYLLFPAFYTDVTDSYRLPRRARIRVDLGGLYFNVLCLLVLAGMYLATDNGLWLLAALIMQLEMVNQLVPAIRLDGYYLLSDLVGVPDLFARVGPVLRSLRPGMPADPLVADLRPGARRVVILWVLFVTPALMLGAVWLLWNLPYIVSQTLIAMRFQVDQLTSGWQSGSPVTVGLSTISLLLLLVPLLGLAVLIWRLFSSAVAHFISTSPPRPKESTVSTTKEPPSTPPSASDFRDDLILTPHAAAPETGWRHALYRATGSHLNLGPGPREQRRLVLEERLRTPITGSRRVVVMSRKGGVGKTTMTFALGSMFASIRGDRVIAVDANPDAGNLAHRVSAPGSHTITDVLAGIETIDTYASLRQFTTQATESRLEVLASDDDPKIGMALDQDDYHRLIGLLDRFYNLIVLDTGTGILDSANQGLLTEADQVVVVLRPSIDGGRAAALTLDWLDQHGYEDLVSRAVVVINAVRKGVGAPLDPIADHFRQRCASVVTVPWDPALETGAETHLSELSDDTRAGLVAAAAAVADGFTTSRALP